MWNALKRLFPENIFARKIDPSAERRLRLAQARAEESIIRAHVDNTLMFVDTLAEDMTFDRAIDIEQFDTAQITVDDPADELLFTGASAELHDPAAVLILMAETGTSTGSALRMTATAFNGIVAVDDGGAWGGVTDLGLPFL